MWLPALRSRSRGSTLGVRNRRLGIEGEPIRPDGNPEFNWLTAFRLEGTLGRSRMIGHAGHREIMGNDPIRSGGHLLYRVTETVDLHLGTRRANHDPVSGVGSHLGT